MVWPTGEGERQPDCAEVYRAFHGRDPDIQARLKKRGFVAEKTAK